MNVMSTRTARRLAVATAVTAGALAATAGTAYAAPVAGPAVAAVAVAKQAALSGPNSPYPGPGWFYWTTYANQSQCLADGTRWILQGLIRSVTCPGRYDGAGYDQWLIY